MPRRTLPIRSAAQDSGRGTCARCWCPAGIHRFQIRGQNVAQQIVGWFSFITRPPVAIRLRTCCKPRCNNPATAARLRPTCRAMSCSDQPCRWRSTTTSRCGSGSASSAAANRVASSCCSTRSLGDDCSAASHALDRALTNPQRSHPTPAREPDRASRGGSRVGRWPGSAPGFAAAKQPSRRACRRGRPLVPCALRAAFAALRPRDRAWLSGADRDAPAPTDAGSRETLPGRSHRPTSRRLSLQAPPRRARARAADFFSGCWQIMDTRSEGDEILAKGR